jgi:hypothetical protein
MPILSLGFLPVSSNGMTCVVSIMEIVPFGAVLSNSMLQSTTDESELINLLL